MSFEAQEKEKPTNIGYWEQVLEAPTPAYAELFVAEREFLLAHVPEDAQVLDVGCGVGRNMATILERTPYVTGIDNDPVAVKNAKQNLEGNEHVSVVEASAVDVPFADKQFDVVVLMMVLYNLNDQKGVVLQEVVRVLQDDGKLLVSIFSETAFDERMKIYKQVNAPIREIRGTTVIFDESLGANVSEQFSLDELKTLGQSAGLVLTEHQKVGVLGYVCEFRKKEE